MSETRYTPQRTTPIMPTGLPKAAPPPMAPPRIVPAAPAKVVPIQSHKPAEDELAPIGLIEEAEGKGENKIRAFGTTESAHERTWKRQPTTSGQGAIRVKTFHARLSDQGCAFLDEQINEWLDEHPEVEVKFATTNIGVFEGKMREPALVINIWY